MGRVCLLNSTGTEVITPASQTDIQAIVTQLITALALPSGAATSEAQASLLAAVSGIEQIAEGNKVVAASATPEALVASSTPCKFVRISAPVTVATGLAVNTKIALVGITGANKRKIKIHPSDIDGVDVPCTDAADIFVEVGVDGESVDYTVFGVPS